MHRRINNIIYTHQRTQENPHTHNQRAFTHNYISCSCRFIYASPDHRMIRVCAYMAYICTSIPTHKRAYMNMHDLHACTQYIPTDTHKNVHTWTCMIYMPIHNTYPRTHIQTCIHEHAWFTCLYTAICLFKLSDPCFHTHTYKRMCTYVYTQTYIHAYTNTRIHDNCSTWQESVHTIQTQCIHTYIEYAHIYDKNIHTYHTYLYTHKHACVHRYMQMYTHMH